MCVSCLCVLCLINSMRNLRFAIIKFSKSAYCIFSLPTKTVYQFTQGRLGVLDENQTWRLVHECLWLHTSLGTCLVKRALFVQGSFAQDTLSRQRFVCLNHWIDRWIVPDYSHSLHKVSTPQEPCKHLPLVCWRHFIWLVGAGGSIHCQVLVCRKEPCICRAFLQTIPSQMRRHTKRRLARWKEPCFCRTLL